MTIEEIRAVSGVKEHLVSTGETLTSLVETLYNSREDVYYAILQELNARYDWDSLESGTIIYYIPKYACSKWTEYYNRRK